MCHLAQARTHKHNIVRFQTLTPCFVLLTQEFDCLLTREIVDLIDREADLLNRGRSEKSLEGLRRRISNLFLQFVETPEFNPEATRFQKVSRSLDTRPQVKPIINERAGVTMA